MKIALVYVSPNGTTKKVTGLLGDQLRERGHAVTMLDLGMPENRPPEADLSALSDVGLLGIGSPIYHMTLLDPMAAFFHQTLPALTQRTPGLKTFTYFTYAGITSGKAFLNAARLIESGGAAFLGGAKLKAPHFYEPGGYPDDAARGTVQELADKLSASDLQPMDRKQIRQAFGRQKPIVSLLYPLAHTIGKRREQPIAIHSGACVGCGLCARECPVGAITVDGTAARDPSKCLYCYHCTVCCPKHAISADIDAIRRDVRFNKKIVGTEEPPNAVY